jgi:DNA-binding winged helix-turn-helix (wHTH) protein
MEEGAIVSKSKTKLELTKHELLFRLLVYLIRHRGQIKHKEELISSLWHERYDPFVHDQVLYVAINKLRKNIEDTAEGQQFQFIRNVEQGYYFNDISSFCFIEKKIMLPDSALTYRQEWVLQFLVDNQKITNKDLAIYFKTSRTTAYKELDELVVKKILKKKGKGRSTYYCI